MFAAWDIAALLQEWSLPIALAGACAWNAAAVWYLLGLSTVRVLPRKPEARHAPWPKVSIVLPVNNEACCVEATVRSMLALDYPAFELHVVNDRSTDGTGDILKRLSKEDPRVVVTDIQELPQGWVGKQNALNSGGMAASGEYILFLDGGVVLERNALGSILSHALERDLDHVTVIPRITMRSLPVQLLASYILMSMFVLGRPILALRPYRRRHECLGMCHLVRSSVFRKVQGYDRCRYMVFDDVPFGKIVSDHGYTQDLVFGRDAVSHAWYSTLRGMIRAHGRISFAYLGYNPVLAFAILAFFVVNLSLWAYGLIMFTGFAFALLVSIYVFHALVYAIQARRVGMSPWPGIVFPAGVVLLMWPLVYSVLLTYKRNGSIWRGTFYGLSDLKRYRKQFSRSLGKGR